MKSALTVEHLSKNFGTKTALNDVSLAIPEESIFGLLGPNGAGKTTLIRIINRIYQGDSGQIFFRNQPLQKLDTSKIGYMPEERGLYPKMKVGELLLFLIRLKGVPHTEAKNTVVSWMKKFNALDWWNMKVEQLSKGMQQKIQFIGTVAHNPEILILDEPFSGFDPVNTQMIKEEIFRLREAGTTIIFSSHRMENVEELCSHVAMINNARIILNGELNEIRKQFRDNHFEARISNKSDSKNELETLPFNILKIQEPNPETKIIQFKLHPDNVMPHNKILETLIRQGEVESFREVYPTLHDIFIELVNDNKYEQDRAGHPA